MAATRTKLRNLHGEFVALRDRILADLRTRPGADKRENARRGAWDAILRPRVQESADRLGDVIKSKRWTWATDADDVGIALSPAHFDHVIRQRMTHLYVRLCGAMRQYYSVRVVWRPRLRFGWTRGRNAPIGTQAAVKAQRTAAEKERAKKQAAMTKTYEKTLAAILAEFGAKQASLRAIVDGLQKALDGLMLAEERRLGGLLQNAPPDKRATAAPHFRTMQDRRRDAQSFRTQTGEDASSYTGMLRTWNGARTKTARALA